MAKKLHTFMGDTPAQALKKAQETFGDEILLVENKEVRKKSLTQPGLYEIVVAVEDDSKPKDEESQKDQVIEHKNSVQKRLDEIAEKKMAKKRQEANKPKIVDEVTLQLSNAIKEISQIADVPSNMPESPPPRSFPPSTFDKETFATTQGYAPLPIKPRKAISATLQPRTVDDRADDRIQSRLEQSLSEKMELREMKQELEVLNDKLKLIQNMFWEERSPKSEGLHIPQEFAEIYRIAKNSGMNKEHLDTIMNLSLELMPLKMRSSSATIKRYFREVLRKMIYCRTESLSHNAQKIMMFVGPTGVGKTTVLAKLAARYCLMLNQRYRVGVITLDTYRLGAIDQIMAYARMMKLSIETVVEPEELANAIDSLKHCDYILIDSAGISPHDRSKLNTLKLYLNNDYKIDVNLILALNAKYEDLRDAFNAFNEFDIDTIIFSKLDESRHFGNMFSLVYETKKPVSYLSIGQSVPNDLVLAGNDYLVDCLLDGFKRPESTKESNIRI